MLPPRYQFWKSDNTVKNMSDDKTAASKGVDPGKCDKSGEAATVKNEVGAAKTGATGTVSHAKDKFSLPFGKRKSAEKDQSKDSAPKKKYTLKDRIKDIKDGFAELSRNRREKKAQKCKAVGVTGSGPGAGGGRMIYPYTLSAKIAQFPYRYYFQNVWLFKYFVIGSLVSCPLFFYLGRKSYSPENVAEWKKNREELFGVRHH